MLPNQRTSAAHIDAEWAMLSSAIEDPADATEKMEQAMIKAAAAIHSYITVKKLKPSTPEPNWVIGCSLFNNIEELFKTY